MTLVELMVTMVIAAIVAASTFVFFAGQQRVYETQTKMLNVQQNVWASMEVISRFVRSAGSGMYGCVRPVGGIVMAPPLNRSPAGPDPDDSDDPPVVPPPNTVHDFSRRPNAGLRAYDFPNPTAQRIPPLWIVDQVDPNQPSAAGIVPGTDVLTVAFGNRSSGTNFDSPLAGDVISTNGAIMTPAGNSVMFQPGEFIVLVGEPGMGGLGFGFASDVGCTLFQITSVASETLNHATDSTSICAPGAGCAGSIWNPPSTISTMIPGAGVYHQYVVGPPAQYANTGIRNFGEFWWVRFAIRTTASDGSPLTAAAIGIAGQTHDVPVLTMERLDGSATSSGPQVLAEGIEDLQVAFACDLNGDGVLTEGNPSKALDEWTLNDPADVVATSNARKCNQPSAVRLTMIARSLTEDNGIDAALTDNGRPAIENHPGHTPNNDYYTGRDQFRRRVLTTTVYPRN
jgi:type II secretory pathway pseudopilin PulG